MQKSFKMINVDKNDAGLTFRLHLFPGEKYEKIQEWFLEKKGLQEIAKEIDIKEISTIQ